MKKITKILISIFIIGFIAITAYTLINSWHRSSLETAKKTVQDQMRKEIQEIQKDIELISGPVIPKEKLIEVFGEDLTEDSTGDKPITHEKIESQVVAFFSYLDKQDYITVYELKGGTHQQFQQAVKKLSSQTPVVIGEMESLYKLFQNMSFFYRALGKDQINLIRDILNNESEIIESAMKIFYQWFTMNQDPKKKAGDYPSLEVLYEYSSYFLNTFAGHSYLFRRDSKVRILTTYYCILILDKANDKQLNYNGIDIRPHLTSLSNDISNQIGLRQQKQYLLKLSNLNKKYQL